MNCFLLILLGISLAVLPAVAQETDTNSDSTATENQRVSGKTSEVVNVAIGVLSLGVYVPVHELGHFITAKAAGAQEARMVFFSSEAPSIAATLVDTAGLTRRDLAVIGLSGVLAGRLLAEGSDLLWRGLDHQSFYPTFGEKFFSTIFVVGHLEFPAYVTQDALLNLLGAPGSDFDIFVTSIAGRNTTSRTLTYLGLLGIAAADIYFDWDRLSFHYGVAVLDKRIAPEPPHLWGLRLGASPGANGLGLRFYGQF